MPSAEPSMPARRSIVRVELAHILPCPGQPRKDFSEDSLRTLADSIQRYGLLSPLLLRRISPGQYGIVAGERRFRAMCMLQWSHADAVILSAYDADCALISLVENLQREQLHFLEEANAYKSLMDEHGFSQETLARLIGRSPSAVANRLRLLKLPTEVLAMLPSSPLTERHARALLCLTDPDTCIRAAETAASAGMSVRQLEDYIARMSRKKSPRCPLPAYHDNRIVINALLDTVRDLNRLGVRAAARVQEQEDGIDVIVSIRTDPEHK